MKPLILALAAGTALLTSCGNRNEDITESVNKNGAIETAVSVSHLDSTHDVLTTSHKVWVHYNTYKTILYHDTIPALGNELTQAENEKGDTRDVQVKKDYEIYITVK
jgi:hypothetical protein